MIGRRIGAAVAAVALIVGALFARNALEDDDAAADNDDDSPSASSELVCATELGDVCRSISAAHPDIAITVEDAGVTLERLAEVDDVDDVPPWLTIDPFPGMVDELRRGTGREPIAADATPVASTRLALGLPADPQAEILAEACVGAPLWRCVGERAGDEWDEIGGQAQWATIDPSLGDVEASALGLASLANAVSGYFGDADVSVSRWESDPTFTPWLRRLGRAVSLSQLSGRSALATMIIRESAVDIAATTDAEVSAQGATGAALGIQYPEPSMSALAVLAVPGGQSAPGGLADDLARALAEAGWEPPAAAGTSLPGPGVMVALRKLWAETT